MKNRFASIHNGIELFVIGNTRGNKQPQHRRAGRRFRPQRTVHQHRKLESGRSGCVPVRRTPDRHHQREVAFLRCLQDSAASSRNSSNRGRSPKRSSSSRSRSSRVAALFALVMLFDQTQVQLIDQIGNEIRQMVLGQPLPKTGGKKKILFRIIRTVNLRHESRFPASQMKGKCIRHCAARLLRQAPRTMSHSIGTDQ